MGKKVEEFLLEELMDEKDKNLFDKLEKFAKDLGVTKNEQ